jgi:D-galactarate dehydratase / Altronate hydrolase, C terminus
MADDMDVNCGTIIDDGQTVEEAGVRIFEEMLAVASGKLTASAKRSSSSGSKVPLYSHSRAPTQPGDVRLIAERSSIRVNAKIAFRE